MNRTIREKLNKKIDDLINTVNKLDLTDIYRTLQPTPAEYSLLMGSLVNSTNILRINVIIFQKTEEEGTLSSSFYVATITLIPKQDNDITKNENMYQYLLYIKMEKSSRKTGSLKGMVKGTDECQMKRHMR